MPQYVHFVFTFLYIVYANQFVYIPFEGFIWTSILRVLSPAHVLVFLFAETLFDSF